MTEQYPSLPPALSSDPTLAYGSGYLQPQPGSEIIRKIVAGKEAGDEYSLYRGTRIAHPDLANAALSEVVLGRAQTFGVTLEVDEDTLVFQPPVSRRVAEELGRVAKYQLDCMRKSLA